MESGACESRWAVNDRAFQRNAAAGRALLVQRLTLTVTLPMHRTHFLDDKGFWLDLEFTLSGHFYDAESPEMRGHWVDGFVLLEVKNTKEEIRSQSKIRR